MRRPPPGGRGGAGTGAAAATDGALAQRLQVAEQVRRQLSERLRGLLATMKWEEPMTRPPGRTYEDVLIEAIESKVRREHRCRCPGHPSSSAALPPAGSH
jgi:hypothetical protein